MENLQGTVGAEHVSKEGALRLLGGRCNSCEALSFPKAPVCPACLSEDITAQPIAEDGVLYTYSIVHVGKDKTKLPYAVGFVDLADGLRLFAHLSDVEGLRPDMPVAIRVTPEGDARYRFQAQPREGS
ncbi:MAG: OB-fold domain-containing protein [Rhodospirillales bacterium]|nr:OB-fold domain-containing protein [Rhodospirillales bacterium]